MSTRTVLTTLPALFLMMAAATASAQSFKAEIDCGGPFQPGDTVTYTMEFENQTLNSIPIQWRVTISIPGSGERRLRSGSFTLGPNQDLFPSFSITLPQGAPNGNYVTTITARSATETSTDTCSFNVQ